MATAALHMTAFPTGWFPAKFVEVLDERSKEVRCVELLLVARGVGASSHWVHVPSEPWLVAAARTGEGGLQVSG